jgi:hypothetical protein
MKKVKFVPHTQKAEWFGQVWKAASSVIPEWYKKISPLSFETNDFAAKQHGGNLSVKRCIPFLDAISSGYVIELQEDVVVSKDLGSDVPKVSWRSDNTVISMHDKGQHLGLPAPKGFADSVYKWENAWTISTPPGYSTYFSHPINRFDLPFTTISGIVDTDAYPIPVHFPFYLQDGFEGIIPKGTPIVQINFVKREHWQSVTEKFSEKRSEISLQSFLAHMSGAYKKKWWIKKTFK